MLYWNYQSVQCRDAGAIPPEPISLPYGKRSKQSPFSSKDYTTVWRAIENGYITQPSDCPPVRLIANYGFSVCSPGKVIIRRLPKHLPLRGFESDRAMFGFAEVGGDPWPNSDSGFIASWIAGSEFVKVQTGIVIFFPTDCYLYQGPLPNTSLLSQPNIDVMAGLEYPSKERVVEINGKYYGTANLNIIVKLPQGEETITLKSGDFLAWFFVLSIRGNNRLTKRVSEESELTP